MRMTAVALASMITLTTTACSSDDEDGLPTTTASQPGVTTPATTAVPARPDIVGTALTAGVFTALAGLVLDAGLLETLRSPGPFTVFAPTDGAFAKVPTETLRAVQADKELLTSVLTYHVVPGALALADLTPGQLMTVAGVPLEVTREGDQVFVNGFPVAAGDVTASNGVIHVMGDVLVPPS
jgi:uncharacterized surface protein with fasciclin (FAS1) repeats